MDKFQAQNSDQLGLLLRWLMVNGYYKTNVECQLAEHDFVVYEVTVDGMTSEQYAALQAAFDVMTTQK